MSQQQTGAHLIAETLRALEVPVIFGIVGIPVIEVADACIAAGIRFISFRNEQAASYAATAYGYLTGRPGVCLVVGGPGVLHAMAGVGNSMVNTTFPLLLLAGAAPTGDSTTKGSFQQLDQVALLAPHTKLALRPPSLEQLPNAIRDAYRAAFYGRPGATYVDLPADYIQAPIPSSPSRISAVEQAPKILADPERIRAITAALAASKSPLVIIGKGAAYARAEADIRGFVDATQIPFLPTPQGKGVVPDSHPLNTSAARSATLKGADFILLIGARVNWILHFGTRFRSGAKIAQVDICAEELGRNGVDSSLSVIGDISAVLAQLREQLGGYAHPSSSPWRGAIHESSTANTRKARVKEDAVTAPGERLSYQRTFRIVEDALLQLAASPEQLVYVSEGANTMDISRSIFSIAAPRQRLDAGTYATMGVGLGYAIAAEMAYNHSPSSSSSPKRVIAIEGDSALGFSLAEIETMARYRLPIIIMVMNNGGVYHGISDDTTEFREVWEKDERRLEGTLPSTALGFETEYDVVARGLGAKGWRVETEEELKSAVEEAWKHQGPSLLNVIIRSGAGGKLSFGWLEKKEGAKL
ncbi:thiamine pyrophosphate enzyme, N-terminal TPP binding domain-containing protein [Tricharina praecox]|uniref:thiamine pyrophosphate enzyme, N-terminal TPP binding domain-containing protein n=1 Tax=Tricharina praecox TaxID=43433 RepID=UPI00221E486A|nr:thiamine pyrophosphate enzyme, N-terminal TPP binding domain-containing protein [Tricharina praecox]KAI5857729.1 thiamine pyrophosphate enzyme, N-terminal TPP binding domain-containing protein [Tricharina praecox]